MNLNIIVTSNIIQPIQWCSLWATTNYKPSGKGGARGWRLRSRRMVQIATLDLDPVMPSSVYPSLHKGDAIHPLESR